MARKLCLKRLKRVQIQPDNVKTILVWFSHNVFSFFTQLYRIFLANFPSISYFFHTFNCNLTKVESLFPKHLVTSEKFHFLPLQLWFACSLIQNISIFLPCWLESVRWKKSLLFSKLSLSTIQGNIQWEILSCVHLSKFLWNFLILTWLQFIELNYYNCNNCSKLFF